MELVTLFQLFFCLFVCFSYQGFLSRTLTTHRTAGEGRGPFSIPQKNSKNVIYILIFNTCDWFYLRQTNSLKQRIRKHKSDVFHTQNTFCKTCSEHLRHCSRMKEPFFRIYPFLYENKKELREFKEKRFIMRWKPQLNHYQ